MPTTRLSNEVLIAAIAGFEQQKTKIDAQIAELRALLSGGPAESAATTETPTFKRRKFSAAARKRMKEAQQRRWAKIKGESEPPAPAMPAPPKAKRKLSKAGRAAIVAATKARWDRVRAEAKKAAQPTTKKVAVKTAAVKTAPPRAAKKAVLVKKGVTKKTAPAPGAAMAEAQKQ